MIAHHFTAEGHAVGRMRLKRGKPAPAGTCMHVDFRYMFLCAGSGSAWSWPLRPAKLCLVHAKLLGQQHAGALVQLLRDTAFQILLQIGVVLAQRQRQAFQIKVLVANQLANAFAYRVSHRNKPLR